MNEEVKKHIFSTLDTESIILPIEIITYHLYRYNYYKNKKRENDANKELSIIKKYLKEHNFNTLGGETCLKSL